MIIFESISIAKKKYLETGKINQEIFDGLLLIDTSKSKKYIEWICKMYWEDKNFDKEIVKELLEEFEKRNKFIEEKDINKYQSIKDLQDAILKAQETKIEKRVEGLTTNPEIVFKNEKVVVYKPKTEEESIDLGSGTEWCISATKSENYWNSYYKERGYTIYIIHNFTVNSNSTDYNKSKIAVLVDANGRLHSIWDKNDNDKTIKLSYIESLGISESIFVARELSIYEKYGISNYTINADGSIDVEGDVNLSSKGLTELPFKFGKVGGGFNCSYNALKSLTGAPKEVGNSFYCSYNALTSLAGAPSKVGGSFSCSHNALTSLAGAPSKVGGDFYCYSNAKKFTKEEVSAVSKVKNGINV